MWVYIKKEDLEKYLHTYSILEEFIEGISLMETKDAMFFPRNFIYNFPSPLLIKYDGKKKVTPKQVSFNFTGELRENQKKCIPVISQHVKTTGNLNGILKMFPGFGKTVTSVYLASKMGLKTCVIVDNSELMKQWIEAFLKFSDLTIDDIGIIQQKYFVTDKPVTIAMAQSLLSKVKSNFNKTFKEIDDAGYGLVIYDEVHCTSSSEKFAKISILFRTQNILGLSATPFQTGLAEILMNNTIGNVIYETNDYDLVPKYFFVHYNSELADKPSGMKRKKDGKPITIYEKLGRTRDYIHKKSYYNSVIVESNSYLTIIQKYTKNLLKNNYRIMIMCLTKKQVLAVSKIFEDHGIEHRKFYGDERDIDKVNDKVLIVTYSFCNKGFDFPSLSALIFACPLSGKKSVIQVVGRILRHSDGKNNPIVIDLIDEDFPLMFEPEVNRKLKIIQNEFNNCEIVKYHENSI